MFGTKRKKIRSLKNLKKETLRGREKKSVKKESNSFKRN
jgi:hypothetical protein